MTWHKTKDAISYRMIPLEHFCILAMCQTWVSIAVIRPWHFAVCASNIAPYRSCSWWFCGDFLVGSWILFFRLLLKPNSLILPLMGFPTMGPGQAKLISILGGISLTMAVGFSMSGVAPLAGGGNGQANELKGRLISAKFGAVLALWCMGAGMEESFHVTVSANCSVWLIALRSTWKLRRKLRNPGTR